MHGKQFGRRVRSIKITRWDEVVSHELKLCVEIVVDISKPVEKGKERIRKGVARIRREIFDRIPYLRQTRYTVTNILNSLKVYTNTLVI